MVNENLLQAAKSLREFFPAAKSLAQFTGEEIKPTDSVIESVKTMREAEDYLRDAAGFSRAKAVAFLGRVKSVVTQRDSDASEDSIKAAVALLKSLKS